ncbi:MAG: hypothetical protein AB8C46_10890 [Burkholderiaceae bacterium]
MSLVPIGRVYESAQQAQETVRQLTENNLPEDAFSLMTSEGQSSESIADIVKAIVAGHPDWVPIAHAQAYAEHVKQGRSLVMVTAPFGRGTTVESIMNVPGAIDVALPEPESRPYGATPLSDFLGFPVLSHERTFASKKGSFLDWFLGDASSPNFKFSSVFGMGMLSKNPTPLSSMIGFKPLSNQKGPGESSFGMKLLRRNDPAPLSSTVGMKPLSANQGRGNSSFGLPTLSKNSTPLSSLLNMPVLSKPNSARRDDN